MSSKDSKKFFLVLALLVLVLPTISALKLYTVTILNATGDSNVSVTITTIPVWVDQAVIDDYSVLLYNASWTNGDLVVNLTTTTNWSTQNANLDTTAFPHLLSTSNNNTKYIASNLTQTVNGTVTVSVDDCSNVASISYLSDSGSISQSWTADDMATYCSSGRVTLTLNGIEQSSTGGNQIGISYEFDSDLDPFCSAIEDSIYTFGVMYVVMVLGIVIAFGIIAVMKQEIMADFILVATIALVMGAVTLILGSIMIPAIC